MQQNRSQASTAVFLLLLLLLLGYCHCCLLEFEAESGDTLGQTRYRSRASGGLTVYLTRVGQHVTHSFSTASTCRAQVHNVRYSNDGLSDVIQVSLDETTMGTFRTRVKSNYGYAWNEFVSTNSIGGGIEIRPGSHELTLSVTSTDYYGVELDKTTLQLTCEGSNTRETDDCSTEVETATQDSTTTEGRTTATPAASDSTPVPPDHCLVEFEFEAENGVTSGRTMQRSRASGRLSVYLTRVGQRVTHTFSTSTVCTAQVNNVRYSNDGQADVIQVSLDETVLGTFRTRVKSDHGNAWNEFLSTNSIGGTIQIHPGSHELTLSVQSTDRYGVELDKTTLQLTCEGSNTGESDDCSTQGETTTQDSTTTTEGRPTITAPARSDSTPIPPDHCVVEFEAENGVTSGRTMQRSRASGRLSVYLTIVGQHVTHTFSTSTVCTAQVNNVRYSNDGQADVIQVSLDETVLGTFRTRVKSDHGNAWNEFLSTNSIGGTIQIHPGSHELTLSVQSTDRYGVELDKTTLQLTCEGSNTGESDDCSMRAETANQDSTTTEGTTSEGTTTTTVVLVSIVATVVIIVIVVIVVIAVVWCARKNSYSLL